MKSYCVSAFLKEKNEFILFISNILFYFKLYEQRPCAAVTVPTLVKKSALFLIPPIDIVIILKYNYT